MSLNKDASTPRHRMAGAASIDVVPAGASVLPRAIAGWVSGHEVLATWRSLASAPALV
ncbi:MAG TPA: hypothetical protein VJ890_23670 [Vineibacter sp.]|nr:hypothetical protein [Vineibacter sp.]